MCVCVCARAHLCVSLFYMASEGQIPLLGLVWQALYLQSHTPARNLQLDSLWRSVSQQGLQSKMGTPAQLLPTAHPAQQPPPAAEREVWCWFSVV